MQQQAQDKKQLPTKMQSILNDLHEAHLYFTHAMSTMSSMIMDLQRGDDWIVNFIKNMVNATEEAGGTLANPSVESELRTFVPKTVYERPEGSDG